MNAIDTTIQAPGQRANTTRIAAVATAVTALVLALAGAAALAANAFRDGDGYFTWPTKTFASNGYAVAMKSVDVSDAPGWALGDARIRVTAHGDRPLFVGIARAGDVDRYLRGIGHDDVSELTYHPFQVEYDHADGHAVPRHPTDVSFWVASTGGTGSLALDWKPRPGNWRAVVMNADGSRGVDARLQLGVQTALLWWIGAALLGAAVLAAAVAVGLHRRARA